MKQIWSIMIVEKKNKKQKLVKYEPLFIIKGWH